MRGSRHVPSGRRRAGARARGCAPRSRARPRSRRPRCARTRVRRAPARRRTARRSAASSCVPGHPAQLGDRVLARNRVTVGVARGHHVVHVADRDHPRERRDVLAAQPARITRAVDPLVVGEDDQRDLLETLDAADEVGALRRMRAHESCSPRRSAPPLASRIRSGNANLPMSCSRPAVWTVRSSSSEQPAASAIAIRVAGDRGRVPRREVVAQRQRADHRHQHADLQRRELERPLLELVAGATASSAARRAARRTRRRAPATAAASRGPTWM